MMRVIAIDDEPIALDIIKNHSEKVPFIELVATFLSANDAFEYMTANPVDLVLLDISMPKLSGLEFAEMIKQKTQVIFTTAYAEYALKGFELAVTDYLLKPINYSRFLQACQLAERRIHSGYIKPDRQKCIFVKDGHNWLNIKLIELLYIRGDDNYVSLFEKSKRTLTRTTLTELHQKLPQREFVRIHKSYIVSLSKIEKIEKHQVTVSGTKIPLTLMSVDSLLELINRP